MRYPCLIIWYLTVIASRKCDALLQDVYLPRDASVLSKVLERIVLDRSSCSIDTTTTSLTSRLSMARRWFNCTQDRILPL